MRYAKTMSEALADVREGFSKKEIKMAIGVASETGSWKLEAGI